jgi:hypothetical protein
VPLYVAPADDLGGLAEHALVQLGHLVDFPFKCMYILYSIKYSI